MTELFDCAQAWDSLPPEIQREMGAAAVLQTVAMAAQDIAAENNDSRRCAILEIAIGVSTEALVNSLTVVRRGAALTPEIDLSTILPDLRPFGIEQCKGCGCIEEVACKGGRSWAEKDLCSACAPVMAEAAGG